MSRVFLGRKKNAMLDLLQAGVSAMWCGYYDGNEKRITKKQWQDMKQCI